ncbi:MAG: glycosyltransferase family 39 protein [Planctomycetota bacterium]|nr:glycosyltransferase family 39 protein [Planctomycetota bacterium]
MSSSDTAENPPPLSGREPQEVLPWRGGALTPGRLQWALGAFLVLGLAARAVRYFLVFPLWEDECFLLVNLLDRGYLEMAEALRLHQVAPIFFLWGELGVVDLLGFSELSVRLLPFVSGVASLFLFRHLAGRLLGGGALVLAVAVFAVAYPGIRYAAEAKPYGTDLLASLVLLVLFVEWWRRPEKSSWLWALAAVVPLAVGLSYPSVFVAGGLSLALAHVLWHERRRSGWLPWSAYNLLLVASFLAHYLLVTRGQAAVELDWMRDYWEGAFPPPLSEPLAFLRWLAAIHTGGLMAWPVGGARGASTLTTLCCLAGLVSLFRARRVVVILLCVLPPALNFIAALLHRYPYGGHPKFSLPVAAAICLTAGLGGAALIEWWMRRRGRGAGALAVVLVLLAAVGAGSVVRDVARPYKTRSDQRARAFARWFYFNAEDQGEVVCLKADLGTTAGELALPRLPVDDYCPESDHDLSWEAMYLCNQRIYSPRHSRGEPPDLARVSAERPLWCVHYRVSKFDCDEPLLERWLREMNRRYELVGKMSYPFPRYDKRERRRLEVDHVDVYRFVPGSTGEEPGGESDEK